MSPVVKFVPLVALALAACASAGGGAANVPLDPLAEAPRTGALGAIVQVRDGQVVRRGSWDEARIAKGEGNGPAAAVYLRTVDGRWKVTYDGQPTLVTIAGNRITGTGTNVTWTRVDGGFRLEGFWFYYRFSLLLARDRAVADGREYVRGADGAYTTPALPGLRFVLEGDANRLDDPPWPQMALAALAIEWGRGAGGTGASGIVGP
jgi:hypothetical protein